MTSHIAGTQINAYGFHPCEIPSAFNRIGRCWQLDASIGGGYYWVYSQDSLFYVKIHDFYFHEDAMLTFDWPATLSITMYDSISGEELSPYRRLNAGCVKTFIGGKGNYPILIHKKIPIHSIGIEITQDYCNEVLKRQYPDSYHQLLPIFTEIDQTDNFPEMKRLLHEMEAWRGNGVAAALYYESKVMEAIRLIVEHHQRKQVLDIYRITEEDKARLSTLVAYINDHFAGDIPQRQMTRIACMGATKLKAAFHQQFGCTITAYIQHRRIAQAEQMLSRTDLTIGQIAQSVGYASASRFSELFRRSTGMRPSDYRAKARQDHS